MKKLFFILVIFSFLLIFSPVNAQEKINLYFFYGDGCPHCADEKVFLDYIGKNDNSIKVYKYEVWNNQKNAELLGRVGKELGLDVSGVPILIIGDKTVVGYYNDAVTGRKIKSIIDDYKLSGCSDIVAPIIRNTNDSNICVHGCDNGDDECMHNCGCEADHAQIEIPDVINVPFFGEVNIKNFSLPLLTVVIAATDGFNPCAMWVLLFLISLLLGMEDKAKMWTLGSAFILASGVMYFLFLSAWLNLFLFLRYVKWIRIVIALVALGSGGYHLYDYYKKRNKGCVVENSEKRRKIFTALRGLVGQKNFLIALGGIVLLAFAVNLVELVCSAGLPAVYTQLLSISNLSPSQYYGYLFLYILIFMLDDLLIFFIAMTTLRMKAISSKYTKYAGVIGGVVMVIIGILLLFKPGLLMFG